MLHITLWISHSQEGNWAASLATLLQVQLLTASHQDCFCFLGKKICIILKHPFKREWGWGKGKIHDGETLARRLFNTEGQEVVQKSNGRTWSRSLFISSVWDRNSSALFSFAAGTNKIMEATSLGTKKKKEKKA